MMIAYVVSRMVGSARSTIASSTGRRRKMDWPRSPSARRPSQRESCTWKGASRPSWRCRRATSSGLASGPAMIEAGSPGAIWISTNATVATTRATGMRASSRRTTYVFTRGMSPGEPDVPQVRFVRRLVAAHLLADRGEAEEIAELHPPDVLVEDLLHLVPHRTPFARVGLAGERLHPLLLVLVTPPAGPAAAGSGAEGRLGIERDAGREHVPRLGLVASLDERRPGDDLKIDLESDRLELLLGHQRVLVHPLVFLGRDPAHRLAGIARVLQQLLRLPGILLIVEICADARMPLGLLGKREARVQTVEGLVSEAGRHDGLHVERRLERLANAFVAHQPLLVVHHGRAPAFRFDDAGHDARHRLGSLVRILLDLHRELVFAGLHAGQPHSDVGHRDEQDLVHVGRATAAKAVRRVGAGR